MERSVVRLPAFLACLCLAMLCASQKGTSASDDYDYSATVECVVEPWSAFYGGGMILNPEMDNGTLGWLPFGSATLESRSSSNGSNFYVVATSRKNRYDGPSQRLNLSSGNHYAISAWLQVAPAADVNVTGAVVKATVRRKNASGAIAYDCAGTVAASIGCWTLLKGGISLLSQGDIDPSTPSVVYFESDNTGVDIWLDSVAVKAFSPQQWRSHQNSSISQNRQGMRLVQVVDGQGQPVVGATVEAKLTRMHFPFGCAIAKTILNNDAYQKWFVERFNVATFENEMKWYSTEREQGKLRYADADAMLEWCEANQIVVRGHNIVWEDPRYVQAWLKQLDSQQLRQAIHSRVSSLVGRYAGHVTGWDVANEPLHFSFFRDALGGTAAWHAALFNSTRALDPTATLFINDYNTLEHCTDMCVTPDQILRALGQLADSLSLGASALGLGLGLEAHFSKPNVAFMRGALDRLAAGAAAAAVWLTEVDVDAGAGAGAHAAEQLEVVLREAYSHAAVDGIVLWSAWRPNGGCYRMCLTDDTFRNLATGDVVDALLQEWTSSDASAGTTDAQGIVCLQGGIGNYSASVSPPSASGNCSFPFSFTIGPRGGPDEDVPIVIHLSS